MAKAKTQKKAASIDMTAMCDVAFLLLTFFILTATAKQPEALPVDTPSSTVQIKLPEADLATLTVGKGKVFFGVTGREVRVRTLELMGIKYGIAFSPEERQKFALIDGFGVPIANLKQIIAMSSADRNAQDLQPGIPKDSLNNQLSSWLLNSRKSVAELHSTQMRVTIKADQDQPYPKFKKIVISCLIINY